jgi:hypothetical protein
MAMLCCGEYRVGVACRPLGVSSWLLDRCSGSMVTKAATAFPRGCYPRTQCACSTYAQCMCCCFGPSNGAAWFAGEGKFGIRFTLCWVFSQEPAMQDTLPGLVVLVEEV